MLISNLDTTILHVTVCVVNFEPKQPFLLSHVVHTRKCYDCEKIDLEILTDVCILSPLNITNCVFMLSACQYVCMYECV
jgi:hypothetical protein